MKRSGQGWGAGGHRWMPGCTPWLWVPPSLPSLCPWLGAPLLGQEGAGTTGTWGNAATPSLAPLPALGTAGAPGSGTSSGHGAGACLAPGKRRLSRGHPQPQGCPGRAGAGRRARPRVAAGCGGCGWARLSLPVLAGVSSPSRTGPCLHLGWAAPALGARTRAGASPLRALERFSLIQQDLSQFNCPGVSAGG